GFTTGETFAETASLSLFPALVPTAELERANSRLSVANYTTIEFTGPPLGGLLFAWRHAAPFLLDAVSFVLAAVLLPTIPRVDRDPPGRTNLRTEILAGLRFLFQRRLLRGLVLALAANN